MTKLLSRTGQQSQEFNAYDANLEYPQYSMITYTGNVYRSNDLIPAGTPFAIGNTGPTWSLEVNGGGGGGGGNSITNGNSNVIVSANSNVTVSVAGNANIVTVTGTGANIAGTLGVSGVSNLGPVGNVIITGGNTGQVLTTNGNGVLSWATSAGNGTALINGTSNVVVDSNANITMSSNSVSNIVLVTASANSTITQTNTLLAEASANTITFGNVRGFSVGQTITSPGILPANTTISGISDRVVTVSEQLLANANVGTSFSVVGDLSQVQITGLSNLGPAGNVIISGGSNGQVLTTDGSGYLSWTTASSSEFVSETGTTELTNGALIFGSPAYSTVATINIPSAGTYLITYNIYGSASVAMSINAALFSPAAALISPSYATVSVTAAATTAPVLTSTFTIVATGSGQYTLRVRQSASGADSFTVRNNANTSSSGQSHITWKKIAGLIPSTGSSVQYINTGTSSAISINPGVSTLVLNGIFSNSGISYNTTTGVYTLTAGITYRLRADLSWSFPSNPTTSTATFFWADATSGSSLLPATSGRSLSVTSTSPEYPKSSLDIVYTPSSNQQVKIVVNNLSTVTVTVGSSVVITQLGTTDVTGFVGVIQNEWNINNTYPSGTIVVKDGALYQANESIPSGTPFVEGTTGATWRPIAGLGNTISNGNSNVVVSANSNVRISVAGNANIVTVTGTGANVAGTLNVTGNATMGHVLPSANAAYDLGSNTAYWRDLYLTGNTIYLGNSTIKSANDIVLIKGLAITANGAAPAVPPQPGQLTVEGNLVAPNATISTTLTANVVTVTTANITSNLIVANANVTNLQSSNASLGNITVTNITVANGGNVQVSSIVNGNSNIVIDANANIRMSANGTANVIDVSAGSLRVNGNTTITGNLTVQGTTTTVNAQSLSVQDPTIELGGGANDSPLITNDGRDRGTVLTTYGTGAPYTTSGITPTSNTFIALTSTTGIVVGMSVGFADSNAIPSGSTVVAVNAGNIEISAPLAGSIADASNIAVGNDVVRFMGWDSSNSEFAFGSNVSNNNNVMTFNQLGNIRAGNVIVTGGVTTGTVSASAGITAENITANANVTAANITANANVTAANITANANVTAANLEVTSNTIVANITANGTVTLGAVGNVKITGGTGGQYLQTDGNGNLTWSGVSAGSTLTNGNSNVVVTANSNISFSSAGNANVLVVTDTGIAVAGTVTATGNVIGANFIGAGHINGNSNVTVEANGNVTVSVAGNANIVQVSDGLVKINNTLSTTNFIANGNVTLGDVSNVKIEGGSNGQILTTDGGGNLSWANAANTAAIVNGNSNVVVAANSNVTVGVAGTANVVQVSSTGMTVNGNALVTGNLTVQGTTTTVNAQSLSIENPTISLGGGPNGAPLTTNDGQDRGTSLQYYTTAPVTAFMGWDNSNGEFAFGSNVSNNNNIMTFNQFGNIRAANVIAISDVAAVSATITGNVTAGNVSGGNLVSANFVTGTLTTAAQPNVTSVGTLTGLTVGGTSNLGPVGNVRITGGSNGQVLTTDGNGVLSWAASSANSNSITNGNSNVVVAANSNVTVSVAGNANIVTVTGTGANVAGTLNATGNVTGANFIGAGLYNGNSNIAVINDGNINFRVDSLSGHRFFVGGGPFLEVLSGVVSVNGRIAATGNVTASRFVGDSLVNGNSNVGVAVNGNISLNVGPSPNVLLATSGGIIVPGAANVGTLSVSGTSNLGAVGNVTITGGSNGQVLTTNGNGVLSWANGGGSGTAITNGNSNVVVAANGNVTVGSNGVANVVIVTGTGANVTGNLRATGNVSGETITVVGTANAGTLNVTGNANVGNLGTTTAIITTANITTINSGLLQNGNSNVAITANGNVTTFVAGNANARFTVTSTGVNVTGTFNATGNANVGNLGTTGIIATGVSNLGPVGNVIITGGSNGQVLTTNGSGGLSWTTSSGGSRAYLYARIANASLTLFNAFSINANSRSNNLISTSGDGFVLPAGKKYLARAEIFISSFSDANVRVQIGWANRSDGGFGPLTNSTTANIISMAANSTLTTSSTYSAVAFIDAVSQTTIYLNLFNASTPVSILETHSSVTIVEL